MTNRRWMTCALLVLVAGCASMQSRPDATVTHVVVCWLKNPGDAASRQRLIDASKEFRTIPGVRGVVTGTVLPGTRPTVESTFDVAVVIDFEDEAALRAYDQHPTHKRAVQEVLQPLVARFIVYDFVNR